MGELPAPLARLDRLPRWGKGIVVGLVAAGVPVLALLLFVAAAHERRLETHRTGWVRVDATVTDVRLGACSRGTCTITITARYLDRAGQSHTYRYVSESSAASGDTVPVEYDPRDPGRVHGFSNAWQLLRAGGWALVVVSLPLDTAAFAWFRFHFRPGTEAVEP